MLEQGKEHLVNVNRDEHEHLVTSLKDGTVFNYSYIRALTVCVF